MDCVNGAYYTTRDMGMDDHIRYERFRVALGNAVKAERVKMTGVKSYAFRDDYYMILLSTGEFEVVEVEKVDGKFRFSVSPDIIQFCASYGVTLDLTECMKWS